MPSRRRLVLTAAGASAALALTVAAGPVASAAARPPAVTTLSVRSGPTAGGTRVTITGTGFAHVTSVSFGRAAGRSLKVESATKLVVTSPASAAGVDNVRVTTSAGASKIVKADRFTFVAAPVVTAVSPASGSSAGGQTITISGSGFTGIGSVSFGGTAGRKLTVISSTRLSVTSPKHAVGQVGIRVTGTYGTSAATTNDHFAYVVPDAWSPTALTYPGSSATDSSASVAGVSCPTATSCVAVGQATNSTSSITNPLVEILAAGKWTGTVLPAAGKDTGDYLSAVSCPSSTSCVAIGRGVPTIGRPEMIAETWNGTSWTAASLPALAGGATGTLSSIWCRSTPLSCVAAGSSSGADPDSPLIETFSGGTWTPTALPIAQGLPAGDLSGVSCSTSSACTAVGVATGPSGQAPMIETWNGTTWSASSAAVPDGALHGSLSAVSCPAADACTAIGTDDTGESFAIQQSFGSWTPTTIPLAAGHSGGDLGSLSCTSLTSCTAAGGDGVATSSGTSNLPLVETFTAGSWVPHTPPAADGATGFVKGMSCTGTTTCTGVGNSSSGSIFAIARA